MKTMIIAHGDSIKQETISKELENVDFIICADGGAEYAFKNAIVPNYLMGDFDSIDSSVYNYYYNNNVIIEKFPVEKDYTDTELCIKKAMSLGSTEIVIIAGVGSRIDHSLGNIGLLHFCSKNGIRGYIVSSMATIYHCMNEITIEGEVGDTISIIPFNGDAVGLCTVGLKYSLSDAKITFGSPLGISNIMIEDKCTIKLKSGEILVIKQILD